VTPAVCVFMSAAVSPGESVSYTRQPLQFHGYPPHSGYNPAERLSHPTPVAEGTRTVETTALRQLTQAGDARIEVATYLDLPILVVSSFVQTAGTGLAKIARFRLSTLND
jgi:hypothetical protein